MHPSSARPPSAPMPPPSAPGPAAAAGFPRYPVPEDFPTTVGNDGRIAWVLGLLGFLPIPLLGSVAMLITVITTGLLQRRRNPVARAVGTHAAIAAAVCLLGPLLLGGGFLLYALVSFDGPVRFEEHPVALSIWIAAAVWLAILDPLLGVIAGVVALVRPISRSRAAAILQRAGRRP